MKTISIKNSVGHKVMFFVDDATFDGVLLECGVSGFVIKQNFNNYIVENDEAEQVVKFMNLALINDATIFRCMNADETIAIS